MTLSIQQAILDNIQKEYFNKTIAHNECFYKLKCYLGSWHEASRAFQTLWMERP